MSDVLDGVSPESRAVIVDELTRRNPELLAELRSTEQPTNEQSDAVLVVLSAALSENYGPGHIPNERGKVIDRAIGHYLLAWPIHR